MYGFACLFSFNASKSEFIPLMSISRREASEEYLFLLLRATGRDAK